MKTLKISVLNQEGEVSGKKVLPAQVFTVKASPALISQAVKGFLANQRRSRAKTKTRAEVVGSGAKIWRQKGTGRARHGDRQAPIFVGGGMAHGPTGEQNYKQKLNRKMARKVIFSILGEKLRENKLFFLDNIVFKKTKDAGLFLQKVRKTLDTKDKISFLLAENEDLKRYLKNLEGVFVLGVKSLNPYFLLRTDFLFLTRQAEEELEKWFDFAHYSELVEGMTGVTKEENNASKS